MLHDFMSIGMLHILIRLSRLFFVVVAVAVVTSFLFGMIFVNSKFHTLHFIAR